MTADLTGLTGDPGAENPARVDAIAQRAAAMDGGVPVVLLPVRLETRFVQVPAPVAVPVTLVDLAKALNDAATPLQQIAAMPLKTTRAKTASLQQKFKREVENPMCNLVATRLSTASAALEGADLLLRQHLDGDPKPVLNAVGGLRTGLKAAGNAIADVRSDWQRERLSTLLKAVAAHAQKTLNTIQTKTLPAAQLRTDLAHAPPAQPGAVTVSPTVLSAGAGTFQTLLGGLSTLRANPGAAATLAAQATTIAVLPEAWKAQLTTALAHAQAGVTPSADLERLRAAVGAIPSDTQVVVAPPPSATQLVDKLLVRIYPDDIAIDTHEDDLTQVEIDAGTTYWQQVAAAGSDEPTRRAAWRALCFGRRSGRAAWVARVMKPPPPTPPAGEDTANEILMALEALRKRLEEVGAGAPGTRVDALLRAVGVLRKTLSTRRVVPAWAINRIGDQWRPVLAALDRLDVQARSADPKPDAATIETWDQLEKLEEQIGEAIGKLPVAAAPPPPQAPNPGAPKDTAWTRAARSGVLPDRFLIVAVSGDNVAHAVAGAPIPADLKLSIDPSPESDDKFILGNDGNLTVGPSIRWMVDYDEALTKGMAVTVPITAHDAMVGFDRIYAIGLRDGTPDDGAQALADLLDNHHYGPKGMALVPIGTPTNNTEGTPSGYHSLDDPDDSYPIEAANPLFDSTAAEDDAAPDGLRLGRALGVDTKTFAHIEGADRRNAAEAQLATSALYPATLGNWLSDNAAPLISRDARSRLSAFVNSHVAARGLIPALRVGAQPYGVLPAIAHSKFKPKASEAHVGAPDTAAQQKFDDVLTLLLQELADDWATIRDRYVAYATDPSVRDARTHFLELLGLEAVSSTSAYRFGVNVAGRHAAAATDPALQFGLPPSGGSSADGAGFGPFALLQRFESVLGLAFGHDPAAPLLDDKGKVAAPYDTVFDSIADSRGYELRWLTTNHALVGGLAGSDPAEDVATLLGQSPSDQAAPTRTREHHRPLLSLLARQALLVAQRDAALAVLIGEGLLTEQQVTDCGASAHFVVTSLSPGSRRTLTTWSYLLMSLADVGNAQGTTFTGPLVTTLGNGTKSMADFLGATGTAGIAGYSGGKYAALAQGLTAHRAALTALAALPVERLEPLLMEHLDIASHRVDAWITGLAHRRLRTLRSKTPVGAFVGAYGWVEDLRPNDAGHQLATDVPPLLADPSHPIYEPDSTEGFLHAPSVDHAVTAAILRGGYVSQRDEHDVENRMAVNLSSRRTRLATSLIEGVRAGNSLGALLGYRLERFLHEYYASSATGVTLDAMIGPLRSAFPSVAEVDGSLNSDTAPRQVCDGLAIIDTVNRWIAANAAGRAAGQTVYDILAFGNFSSKPWGLGSAIPQTSTTAQLDGIARAIDHLADALDALGDIVVAESVHQIARGNHARAAAVVSALAAGKAPPAPEVVQTPRTGTPLTHRVLLGLPDSAGAPAGWEAIAMTPRALAEPAVNAWAAGLLGAPEDIRIRLVHASDDLPAGEVTIAQLGLHALDLVAILGPGFETGLGEMAVRALDSVRPADLDDDIPPVALKTDVLTRGPSWGNNVRTLAEVAPLLEAIGALLGRGRPADAHDFLVGEQSPAGSGSGVDLNELETRLSDARDALEGVAVSLLRLLSGDPTLDAGDLPADGRAYLAAQNPIPDLPRWADRETWRSALMSAAAFGIPAGLQPSLYENRVQVQTALRAGAETALVEVVQRLGKASPAADSTAASLTATAQAIFGRAVVIVPSVALRNRAELDTALAADLASAVAIDGWLEGIAAVRESAAGLADLVVLADAHGAAVAPAQIAQLPHGDGERWVGDELPVDTAALARTSLVIHGAAQLPADGDTGSALLVDQWTEIVPGDSETTGVAIHYDQPDSAPPQCVLVAVAPDPTANWQLGALVQTLHDTLELAKSRAVELEHLQTTMYGQLLPAISSEVIPDAVRPLSPDEGRVFLDFAANN